MNRPEIIMRTPNEQPATRIGSGTLEILSDGFGFLRESDTSFAPGAEDIYVSPSQIRRFDLKTGDLIEGKVRAPKDNERYHALIMVKEINGGEPDSAHAVDDFHHLTPVHPNEPIVLSVAKESPTNMAALEIFTPIGLGQRGIIVAPPRTGVTTLIKDLAAKIESLNPDVATTVLLLDSRPEDVTDFRDSTSCEVISTTFDEPHSRHLQAAEVLIERSKRQVELGHNEVVIIDSLNQLVRAYNAIIPDSGRSLPGGLDPAAIVRVKRLFGAARAIKAMGSLTIIAVVKSETGSTMDELLLEELRGVANLEIVLSKDLARRRLFPAIDLTVSTTTRGDLLRTETDNEMVDAIVSHLPQDPFEALQTFRSNAKDCDSIATLMEALAPK
jgi:transcription termination factor Rho